MSIEPARRAGEVGPDSGERYGGEWWPERRRIERLLHDGPALRISALVLQLGLLRHRLPEGEPALHESVVVLQDELHDILDELRDVAERIYPPLLDQAGLGPALREAIARIPVPVHLEVAQGRFGAAAEGAAYYAVTERLGRLDQGRDTVEVDTVHVVVAREGDTLTVTVDGDRPVTVPIPCA